MLGQAAGMGLSTGLGVATGGTQGARWAGVVDTNNRQLHDHEVRRLAQLAREFQRLMAQQGIQISEWDAFGRLMAQAAQHTDSRTFASRGTDPAASAFLSLTRGEFTVNGVTYKEFLASSTDERNNHALFADSLVRYQDAYARAGQTTFANNPLVPDASETSYWRSHLTLRDRHNNAGSLRWMSNVGLVMAGLAPGRILQGAVAETQLFFSAPASYCLTNSVTCAAGAEALAFSVAGVPQPGSLLPTLLPSRVAGGSLDDMLPSAPRTFSEGVYAPVVTRSGDDVLAPSVPQLGAGLPGNVRAVPPVPAGYQPVEVMGLPPGSRAVADMATGEIKVLGPSGNLTALPGARVQPWVFDGERRMVPVVEAPPQYAFATGEGIMGTGRNLEAQARQFVQQEQGANFGGFLHSQRGGTNGLDLAYYRFENGQPQLVFGEAKAADSALTAFGANNARTLDQNLAVVQASIEAMPRGALRTELLRQIESRGYTVELYVSTSNLVSTPRRMNEILVDRLQQPASRVVVFPRR
jgi:hypothetical protein